MRFPKCLFIITLYTCILLMSFHQYCAGRSFVEIVGTSPRGVEAGLLFGLLFPLLLLLSLILSFKFLYTLDKRRTQQLICTCCISLIFGCSLAEIYVSHDELQFLQKVSHSSIMISRDRAWPNQNSSFVYIPGRGVHVTD